MNFKNRIEKGFHIPHACEQLNESTISKSEGNDEVRRSNATGLEVDQGEHEGGEGESRQAQRSRVGELPLGDGLVETGLEFTTEGRKACGLAGVGVEEGVSAKVVGADLVAVGGGVGVDGVDGGLVVDHYGVGGNVGHGGGVFVFVS